MAEGDHEATFDAIALAGFEVVRELPTLGWVIVTEANHELRSRSLEHVELALATVPTVLSIEPVLTYELTGIASAETTSLQAPAAAASNDPLLWLQWGNFSTNETDAWEITEGAGVVVAVIDSGIDLTHEDLPATVLPGFDVIDGDTDVTDTSGHGTHVAGTIAAPRNNGLGGSGIAPAAQILPVRACDDIVCTSETVAAGIEWAVANGADVINISIRGPHDPLLESATLLALANDIVVVAATGNDYFDGVPIYPAAFPGVIGVGALTPGREVADFSNTGSFVDVVAPGAEIWSSVPAAVEGVSYRAWNGTSMATPHVAAIAALLRAANPSFTQAQVSARIQATAVDIGIGGFDTESGFGAVDAYRALTNGANPTGDYVEIDIEHAAVGNLQVELGHSNSGSRLLFAPNPGNSHDDIRVRYSLPDSALAAVPGTWILGVADVVPLVSGEITGFRRRVQGIDATSW
ncbi:MAG: S8 family serine peptidase [Chloroflexi bacterium]|nr:S8 family serine peptidase [Chloroflexota bacterium]